MIPIDRFFEHCRSTSLLRAASHGAVWLRRYEDRRRTNVERPQVFEKLDSAHARHVLIQQEADARQDFCFSDKGAG